MKYIPNIGNTMTVGELISSLTNLGEKFLDTPVFGRGYDTTITGTSVEVEDGEEFISID